jgi:hypothetical protein
MAGASRLIATIAAVVAAPTLWANTPPVKHQAPARHHATHASMIARTDMPLALMDLTPHDYLVRPYTPPPIQLGERTRTAVDLHFASDGPVVSLGYNHLGAPPVGPTGAILPSATSATQPKSNVGALVTYPFR